MNNTGREFSMSKQILDDKFAAVEIMVKQALAWRAGRDECVASLV